MRVITDITKDTIFIQPEIFKLIYSGLVADKVLAEGVTMNKFTEACCGHVMRILNNIEREYNENTRN